MQKMEVINLSPKEMSNSEENTLRTIAQHKTRSAATALGLLNYLTTGQVHLRHQPAAKDVTVAVDIGRQRHHPQHQLAAVGQTQGARQGLALGRACRVAHRLHPGGLSANHSFTPSSEGPSLSARLLVTQLPCATPLPA